MNKLALILAVLTAFVLTSCEKENVAEMIENSAASTLKPTNFVLMQKGYVDGYGYVGNMYVDENNPENCYFEVTSQSRGIPRPYYGTLYKQNYHGIITYLCQDTPKNCWKDGGVVSFPEGTIPIDMP